MNIAYSLVIEGVYPEKRNDDWFLRKRSKTFLQYTGKTITILHITSGLDREVPFIVSMIKRLISIPVGDAQLKGPTAIIDKRERRVITDVRGLTHNVISGLICADAINKEIIWGMIDFGLNRLVCSGTELASD